MQKQQKMWSHYEVLKKNLPLNRRFSTILTIPIKNHYCGLKIAHSQTCSRGRVWTQILEAIYQECRQALKNIDLRHVFLDRNQNVFPYRVSLPSNVGLRPLLTAENLPQSSKRPTKVDSMEPNFYLNIVLIQCSL